MKGVTLRQLRYFDSLARLKHFGQAARECAVSQPALSMQIAEMEKQMGAQLVERNRRKIILTREGHAAAAAIRDVLSALDSLEDAVQQKRGILCGPLTIGIIPSIAPYVLSKILPALHKEYPQLDLIVRETQTNKLLEALREGAVDVALLSLPVSNAGFSSMTIGEDPFVLAFRAGKNDTRKAATVLQEEKLLLLEEGHCLRDQALSFCSRRGMTGPVDISATSLSTIMQMVAEGYGATLLPLMAVNKETRHLRQIKVLHFAKPAPSRRIGLIWRQGSPALKDFEALGALISKAI